eukprot:2709113-Pleurochrysis_carterae.AAC.1
MHAAAGRDVDLVPPALQLGRRAVAPPPHLRAADALRLVSARRTRTDCRALALDRVHADTRQAG